GRGQPKASVRPDRLSADPAAAPRTLEPHGPFGGDASFARAFNFSTSARVLSGSALALSSQDLQHRNTGWPLAIPLYGFAIAPRRFSSSTAQNFCASASWRSSGSSFARLAATLASLP